MEKIKDLTIEELEEKIDERDINKALSMVTSAVLKIENINSPWDCVMNVLGPVTYDKCGNKVRISEEYETGYTSEYLAKLNICNLLKKALKMLNVVDIEEFIIIDDLPEKDCKLDNKIFELATRLIIPKSFFSKDLARDIIEISENDGKGLIDIQAERNLIIQTLCTQFKIYPETAETRLKVIDLSDYKYEEYELLSQFYHDFDLYYENDEKEVPAQKG